MGEPRLGRSRPGSVGGLDGFEAEILPERLSGDVVSMELPGRIPEDSSFVAYLGVFDLLSEGVSQERLGTLIQTLGAVEGRLRYELFEKRRTADSSDRVARMTETENHVTAEWLIPQLEAEIRLLNERNAALERAVDQG
jgi:hypothetical protein